MSATVFFSSSNELARVSNTFKVNDVATDPTTVTLTITEPDGTTTAYTYGAGEITKDGTGVYHKDVTSDSAGTWQYQWEGTGTATDAVVGTWEVEETELGKLYCTIEALKSWLNITNDDDDTELHGACFAASRWIEQHCDRHFWRTSSSEVRTFVPDSGYCLELPAFNDLVSVTSLKTDASGDGVFETTWTSGDYQLLPVNPGAAPERKPYAEVKAVGSLTFSWLCTTSLARDDRVQITGVFGWPAIPRTVKQAAKLMAAELYKHKDAPLGTSGDGEFAIPVIGQAQRAQNLLKPYRRDAVLVA